MKLPYKKTTASATLSQQKKSFTGGGFTYSRNELFQISFQLCSTKLAQNGKDRFICGYISLSSVFLRLFDQFILTISVKMRCVFNCNLRVSSFLTVDLLGLLKWRSQKDKLPTILPAVMKVSGEEIVKVFVQISFHLFRKGSPSASADFQGALRLYYNSISY